MSSTKPDFEEHSPSGPPAKEVIARGYEADVYDTRTVLSVPLLVILFFVLAFGTVTILFSFIAYPKADPRAKPLAVEKNSAPLNDRLLRNDRGPKDGYGQPRLEPLKLLSGDSRAITRPALPVAAGNSPELHPEDLRPTKERYPALYATGPGKLGLDKTLELDEKALRQLFPVQKIGSAPTGSQHVPTAANSGRGAEVSIVGTPGSTAAPAHEAPPHPKGAHE